MFWASWRLTGKESACGAGAAGHWSSTPGVGRPPGGGRGTHSSILAWESHGQRSLEGYRPRGHKGSDTTEWLSTHAFKCCLGSARYQDTAPVWPDLSPVLLISVKLKFWDTERESIERSSHCPLYLLLGTLNSDRFQLSAQWPWLSKVSTSKTVVHSVSGTLRI